MGALARAWRWAWTPSRPAPLVTHETWACPVCGRSVEVEAPPFTLKRRGCWLPPTERELVAVCATAHGEHRRSGGPLVPPSPPDPELRWRPVVDLGEGRLLVLVPPSGVGLVPVDGGYEVVRPPHLEASDLVGDPLAGAEPVGTVPADAVVVDAERQLLDWELLSGSTPSAMA